MCVYKLFHVVFGVCVDKKTHSRKKITGYVGRRTRRWCVWFGFEDDQHVKCLFLEVGMCWRGVDEINSFNRDFHHLSFE